MENIKQQQQQKRQQQVLAAGTFFQRKRIFFDYLNKDAIRHKQQRFSWRQYLHMRMLVVHHPQTEEHQTMMMQKRKLEKLET